MKTAIPDAAVSAAPQDGAADAVHPAALRWAHVLNAIEAHRQAQGVSASRTLVLVPYAQLMAAGRRAWALTHPNGFAPRFESSRNWATSLQPFAPTATDWSGDMARDALVAGHLLERVARGRVDPALKPVMVARLVEAARQLAPLAAARTPSERQAWADGLRASALPTSPTLQWEALLASLALAWAGTSRYASDVLWSTLAEPGGGFDSLVVLQGFQADPLADALLARWGARGALIHWHEAQVQPPVPRLHACGDAEDEAQRAAACVVKQASAGRLPVALVANDRLLTRRISALLQGAGLTLRDETGWKLSTTHAAAQLMALLRAADRQARTDDVLDWLKQTRMGGAAKVSQLEKQARALGLSHGASALTHPKLAPFVPVGASDLLTGLQAPRPLAQWLGDLAQALRACGWWEAFTTDQAGQQIVQALRLGDGAAHELSALTSGLGEADLVAMESTARRGPARMGLHAFSAWVRDALEAASFTLRGADEAGEPAVVILPMAQLLGRVFGAVVAPGCDEVRLQPSPEPPGQWTPSQRETLGLPGRDSLAEAAHQAWQSMTALPQLDLLWRTQDQGEAVLPSPWVLAWTPSVDTGANDPRVPRSLRPEPQARPTPAAGALLPDAISASAYQDLRDCPYRFFALRQLRLQEDDELEAEPDKRDMGIWLHAVLKAFHEQRAGHEPDTERDRALIDSLADSVAIDMGLTLNDGADQLGSGQAGFLPFLAAWPALRDGYLKWLAGFEATAGRAGPRFQQAELSLGSQVGPYRLVGKLDRVDHQDSPEGAIPFVIDYKTEPRKTTTDRVKQPLEDTQIGFYAALLPDETLRAAYLSISESRNEKEPTQLVEQTEVIELREHLREGLMHDLDRVAAGHPMPALGEGRVCEFCAARGLCRKDFWTVQ